MLSHTSSIPRIAHPYENPTLFTTQNGGLKLRPYQQPVLEAVVDSVRHQRGLSFVVIFPRQAGKNETQAAIFAYLMFLFQNVGGDIVSVSPTYKPQSENAMHRLRARLDANSLTRPRYRKSDYIFRLGLARVVFFSGEQEAKVVGSTASLLLSVDEAQDVPIPKYDKDFEPMVASTNATRVFWGTRWTSTNLLEREMQAAAIAEKRDGRRRVFFITADDVSPILPPYAEHVAGVIARHGRDHPLVKTQYFGETIDAESGMFPPARIAILDAVRAEGSPKGSTPPPDLPCAFLVDVAGADEASRSAADYLLNPGRDSTALSVAGIDISDVGTLQGPTYHVTHRHTWTGEDQVAIFGQLTALAETHHPLYFIVDATGVGEGLAAMLIHKYGPERVIPIHITAQRKSEIGYRYLSIVNTGRMRLHDFGPQVRAQYEHCRTEILPGPQHLMRWAVPEGERNPLTGELIHDDYLLADSFAAVLDELQWTLSGPTTIIETPDPMEDADYAY